MINKKKNLKSKESELKVFKEKTKENIKKFETKTKENIIKIEQKAKNNIVKLEEKAKINIDRAKKKYLGGLKYSQLIKNGKFKITKFLKNSLLEGQFLTIFRIVLRTLWLGWSVPFMPLFSKFSWWSKFAYKQESNWGKKVCKIAKIKLHVKFLEPLSTKKNYLFASNHLSPMDMAVISASMPFNHQYIANMEFASFFVTKEWVRYNGGVFVNKKDRNDMVKALKRIKKNLERGYNLILFPESNMSPDGELKEFKRGGLAAAILAEKEIVPIYLKGTRDVMKPGDFTITKNKDAYIYFGKPIDTKNLTREEKKNVHIIVYEKMIELKKIIENDIAESKEKKDI